MIPFVDLAAQHESIREEVEEAVVDVLRSGRFVLGESVQAFEQALAEFCGVEHAVGVNSGTSALHLTLLGLGIGPEDEVITVPATFVATVAAILYCGARPVLVDVDSSTCTMDPRKVESAIGSRTRAIIPVHLYGQPADMDPINEIASSHGIPVIEDAAQAHGARYKQRLTGSLGRAACFSFYPSKNLGAAGEGGAVVTNDGSLADRVRQLRDWGQRERGLHETSGFNARLESLQAAVLRVKLHHLADWNRARRERAAIYDGELASSIRRASNPSPETEHVYHLFPIRVRDRDRLGRALASRGVATGVHYARPVHLHPAYASLGYAEGDFPEAEALCRETLSLPMYPELALADVVLISSFVNEAERGI